MLRSRIIENVLWCVGLDDIVDYDRFIDVMYYLNCFVHLTIFVAVDRINLRIVKVSSIWPFLVKLFLFWLYVMFCDCVLFIRN